MNSKPCLCALVLSALSLGTLCVAAPLKCTNATPAEVDAFVARWASVVQTNGLMTLAPMLQAETNAAALTGKLLGTLDREPATIWVFLLQSVAEPPRHGMGATLPPEQTVSLWKQACAILEKWSAAPDRDLDRLELRVAQTEGSAQRPLAELEKSLRTEDPHNEIARQDIRMGLEMARHNLALACLAAGQEHLAEAQKLGRRLLAENTVTNWNYGNIVYDAHSLLGRVALRQGDRATARSELREAGHTPGSPQLDSFGPQFDLARELLKDGDAADHEAVVAFLDDVAKFWANPDKVASHYKDYTLKKKQELESWKMAIRAGKIPDSPKWR